MERSTDLCGDGAKLHEQDRFWWDFEPAGPLPGLQMVAGGASCLSLLGKGGNGRCPGIEQVAGDQMDMMRYGGYFGLSFSSFIFYQKNEYYNVCSVLYKIYKHKECLSANIELSSVHQ